MPRCARIKSADCMYHIMVRSISDTRLYREDRDKDKYMKIIKKYQDNFLFKILGYCIMDTHAHLIVDTCGADISRIMHVINQCYAQYYNKKYNRHGHLFQDRFKSRMILDDRYLVNLSAYVHLNPKDIKKYRDCTHNYKYSSLGVYLGVMEDELGILDTRYLLEQFSKDMIAARKLYIQFLSKYTGEIDNDTEFRHERSEYRTERKIIVRHYRPKDIVEFVAIYTKQSSSCINIKHTKKNIELKALTALLMRGLCNMKQKEICTFFGDVTQAYVSKLCLKGIDLVNKRDEYRDIIQNFIDRRAS